MLVFRSLAALLLVLPAVAPATAAQRANIVRKPDLGDAVAGTYFGNVISDSKGSSHADVTITVVRTGINQIAVSSDYPRLPPITVRLNRAMDKILAAGGDSNFLYDPAKTPPHLDISFHNEVSWSGERR